MVVNISDTFLWSADEHKAMKNGACFVGFSATAEYRQYKKEQIL